MARLWTCGFELQSVTAGVEVLSVTGTPTISTTVHRAGAASLRINPSAATQYVEQQIDSGTVKRTLHRFYLRITTLPSADCNIYGIGQSGYFPGLLRLKTTGVLTLRDGFTAADIGTASAALTTGVWYCIELDYTDTAGTAGSVTGAFKGYVNGVEFSSTVCSNINGWSRVRVGAQTAVSGDFHIDDVAVNDTTGSAQTGLPGPGNVVHLKPNAAGDNNLFGTAVGGTAGAGNNYTRLNETTPDDATSYNETAATGTTTIDDVNLDSSASSGIGAGERVALVQVGARIGSNAATAASLVYRIKSQAAGTVLESASVSVALNGWASQKAAAPYVYQLTSYTDPQAGGAWTQALLDTAQIGYRTNVSQATTRRVSSLWALVETIPVTTAALGTASEAGSGQSLARSKSRTQALASETDAAQPLARRKTLALGTASETDAARPLAALAGVPFGSLTDDFNDGVVDPAKWPDSYDLGGYSEVGGRARVACTTAYNAYASAEAYRLRESSVHVRMWPPAAGGATAEAWAQLLVQTITLGTDAIFEVSAITGNLIMAVRTGYFDPGQVAITYDATAHAWLRIRETGGQLYWDTSPDGASWTNRRAATSPGWVGDTTLQVQLISHRDGGTDDFAEFDSFNSAPGQSAALSVAAETDTAQAIVGRKALALGPAGDTTTAQIPGRTRARALAQAVETSIGQALSRSKRRTADASGEGDAGQGLIRRKARALASAVETDTAVAVSRSKRQALGVAVETNAAQPIGGAAGLQQAEESSTARPLGRLKATTLGVAGEVGAVRPLGRAKVAGLTVVAETATARPLPGGRSRALTPAEETWTARPLVQSRVRQLPPAVEGCEALGLVGGSVAVLGRASETDEARPVIGRKTQASTTALTVEAAQPVTGRKTQALAAAGEMSEVQLLAAGKRAPLVAAVEVAEAQRLLVPGAIAPAEETSTARPLVGGKRLGLTPVAEVTEAQQLGMQSLLALGRALELAGTLPVGRRKARSLPTGASLDAAQSLLGTKTCALGKAAEVSQALIGPRVRLTQAIEHGQALALVGRRQQPADHLHPGTSGPVLTPSTSGPGLSTSSSGPRLAATTTSGG
ncbi:hypothetical protein [Streptomyces sp. NPDC047042]|uniref:hypothetical protein n=1 Tax=Streptomyces sp. NPDC047042 TaxID=3154807 RepID=UPI003406DDA4